jgi:hypothetical protein
MIVVVVITATIIVALTCSDCWAILWDISYFQNKLQKFYSAVSSFIRNAYWDCNKSNNNNCCMWMVLCIYF